MSTEEPATAWHPEPPAVKALDNDGVGVTTAGTIVWAVALVITSLSYSWLHKHGWQWAIGTCAIAVVLGLIGIWYTVRRRSAYRAAEALGDPRITH